MKIFKIVLPFFIVAILTGCQKSVGELEKTGTLIVSFNNTVKGASMQLNNGSYTNSFGEQYSISKFKYYVSNLSFSNQTNTSFKPGYFLIDEGNVASKQIRFELPVDTYLSMTILIGVDSLRNVSGAQTGALDPLNDMFWTWNSGYIMAKMEGNSPQSPIVNNKVEYHIGGFSGANNSLQNRGLLIPVPTVSSLQIREDKISEIFIEADFDTWWQGAFNLKIATNPTVTHPGALAKSISDNYSRMFTITDVKNY